MMTSHRRLPSRAAREQLLDGRTGGHAPLDRLVDAARGPAMPHEQDGLAAALSVFQGGPVGDLITTAPHRRRRVAGVLATTGITAKIVLASLSAAAVGGLTYAAANGDLTGTSHQHSPATTTSASGGQGSGGQGSGGPGSGGQGSGGQGSGGQGQPGAPGNSTRTIAPSPTAALSGTCSSWFAAANDPYRASHARFAVLIAAAGGAENVDAYCTGTVGVTHPARPTDRPSGAPSVTPRTSQPTGSSHSSHRSDPATEPPTGRPTTPSPTPHR